MMRAPRFRYYAARDARDAAIALASEPDAILLAGGTDVLPKLKRRQTTPSLVVSLRRTNDLRGIAQNGEMAIGAMTTLRDLLADPRITETHALYEAVSQIATPLIRNSATLGGNLALDTRCNYYDQSEEWRTAIGGCMKLPLGDAGQPAPPCWVAPSSPRCWAVSSSDAAPALIALGARVTLVSPRGARDLALEDLYADDGAAPLAKHRDEILTAIRVPRGWHSTYWKLRRRGSFDFPVLGVAVAIRFGAHGIVDDARIVLGAVASRPLLLAESESLRGTTLTDDGIDSFAARAAAHAKPLDNTDFSMTWRKSVARTYLAGALRELREQTGGSR
ncbi:MAG TPA: FAD binding domain-containing protein [Thermoanaerobaculia bacterium]|nr:FAD binding domain-containing protein [Thermoanaerobaculia bacterium]